MNSRSGRRNKRENHIKTLVLILSFVALSVPASAQTLQDQMICQQAAQKAADDWKDPDWDKHTHTKVWVESHFNIKLRVCIAHIHTSNAYGAFSENLMDAVGGQVFGSYQRIKSEHEPFACHFEAADGTKTYCKTSEEWDAAVHSYMTN